MASQLVLCVLAVAVGVRGETNLASLAIGRMIPLESIKNGFLCNENENRDNPQFVSSAIYKKFVDLRTAIGKLSLESVTGNGDSSAIEVSYDIYTAYQSDPDTLMRDCPLGIITALTYLSIAQDLDWKYPLLHKATYMLYATPGAGEGVKKSLWPINDNLIKTLYLNSEQSIKTPLPLPHGNGGPSGGSGGTTDFLGKNSISVSFKSILFYNFYLDGLCECTTRSWCIPFWLRSNTNSSVEIYAVGRDEMKTVYRMNQKGCFRPTGQSLATHVISDKIDVLFVFEINAFMNPESRIIKATSRVLYPAYALSSDQIHNINYLGVDVIEDDAMYKPPNPHMMKLLTAAYERLGHQRVHRLLYPAEIRPLKGQLEFLQALEPDWLGIDILLAGSCGGNVSYCDAVDGELRRLSPKVQWVATSDDKVMADLYATSKGIVLAPIVDCNPRAVYEALWTNTPFLVSKTARIPRSMEHLGRVFQRDIMDEISLFAMDLMRYKWKNQQRFFAESKVVDDVAYKSIIDILNNSFLQRSSESEKAAAVDKK